LLYGFSAVCTISVPSTRRGCVVAVGGGAILTQVPI
jgi:hypothetical protein